MTIIDGNYRAADDTWCSTWPRVRNTKVNRDRDTPRRRNVPIYYRNTGYTTKRWPLDEASKVGGSSPKNKFYRGRRNDSGGVTLYVCMYAYVCARTHETFGRAELQLDSSRHSTDRSSAYLD